MLWVVRNLKFIGPIVLLTSLVGVLGYGQLKSSKLLASTYKERLASAEAALAHVGEQYVLLQQLGDNQAQVARQLRNQTGALQRQLEELQSEENKDWIACRVPDDRYERLREHFNRPFP